LRDDVGETNDLAAIETQKFEELKSLWEKWNDQMADPQ
jgi:hypothetical protein